ncbi:lysine-sensitive aspartokinase 3 [Candidatus Kapabacteria bacterium]|nr:lysine-sensitive aspartokinase 3 [Candidatus Kapabacteria bacterium]
MTVKKFGGTSVGTAEMIKKVKEIVSFNDEKVIVVVSAVAKTTNRLVSLLENLEHNDIIFANNDLKTIYKYHFELISELGIKDDTIEYLDKIIHVLKNIIESVNNKIDLTNNQKDVILSCGELLSSKIVYQYLLSENVKASFIDSREIIKTDSEFTNAEVNLEQSKYHINNKLKDSFKSSDVIIMGGFIASDEKGRTTTIGRGGSDFSASVMAWASEAEKLEIWTDVDGIMSIDPKLNKNALRILQLSYDEAAELAYFGAKVLHPKTIGPAIKAKIPVIVKNTFNPNLKGTWIQDSDTNTKIIKAFSYWDDIIVINIKSNRMLGAHGFLNNVFEIFKNYKTPVDLIATSEVSLSLTIDSDKNLGYIIGELEKFSNVTVHTNHSIISAIGDGIKETAGIASRFFGVLKDVNIKMVSIGASEVNISIVVHQGDLERSLDLLHKEFFDNLEYPNIFERIENGKN